MGDTLKSVPSGKEYTGQKFTGTLDLQALVKEINELSQKEVIERLAQYKDVFPGRSPDKNTYEMMGLYQAALQYLGYDTIKIDGRFGPATHQVLRTAQKEDLNISESDCDGLPGPTTTKALIEALKVPAAPAAKPAPTPAPAPAVAPAAKPAPTPAPAASKPATRTRDRDDR